jgi:acyl carrier protein
MMSADSEMYELSDIVAFLVAEAGVNPKDVTPDSQLVEDLGIDGDDFFDLIDQFSRRFAVEMSAYRWYFHHNEEGVNFGAALFDDRPSSYVGRIPVTPKILLQSANAGKWVIPYPPHELPTHRRDLIVNGIFAVGCLVLLIAYVFQRCRR